MTCVASSTDSTTSPCTQVKGQYIKTVAVRACDQYMYSTLYLIRYCNYYFFAIVLVWVLFKGGIYFVGKLTDSNNS